MQFKRNVYANISCASACLYSIGVGEIQSNEITLVFREETLTTVGSNEDGSVLSSSGFLSSFAANINMSVYFYNCTFTSIKTSKQIFHFTGNIKRVFFNLTTFAAVDVTSWGSISLIPANTAHFESCTFIGQALPPSVSTIASINANYNILVLVTGATASFTACKFKNFPALGQVLQASTMSILILTSCEFSNNAVYGSVIKVNSGSFLTVSANTLFHDMHLRCVDGPGIFLLTASTGTVSSISVYGNTAVKNLVFKAMSQSKLSFHNATVYNNRLVADNEIVGQENHMNVLGYLIEVTNASTISNVSVHSNSAASKSLEIVKSSNITVLHCKFYDNSIAMISKGIVMIGSGPVILENCLFQSEAATQPDKKFKGVFVNIGAGCFVNITSCTFSDAATGNGAVYLLGQSKLYIQHSFFANIACVSGCGVYASSSLDVIIENTKFRNNMPKVYGNDIYSANSGIHIFTISSCFFTTPSSRSSIYSAFSRIDITSSIWASRQTEYTSTGSALQIVNPTSVAINNCTFAYQKGGYGGAIFIRQSEVNKLTDISSVPFTITGCTFGHNEALRGGAIYTQNVQWILLASNTFLQNQALNTTEQSFAFT